MGTVQALTYLARVPALCSLFDPREIGELVGRVMHMLRKFTSDTSMKNCCACNGNCARLAPIRSGFQLEAIRV
jgi:hypothetical protein